MTRKKWTIEENEFIIKNYSTMKTVEIAKALGVSYPKLKSKIDNMRKSHNFEKDNSISDELLNKVEYVYSQKSTSQIDKDSLFEIINTEQEAYWLGFLYADGCINVDRRKKTPRYSLEVGLSHVDIGHLEKLKIFTKTNSKIQTRISKIKDKEYLSNRIAIYNSSMCKNLIANGCTPKKSLTLKFPTSLSDELLRHFIRGYFDGDGCIHKSESILCSFTGTFEFLDKMSDYTCSKIDITKTSIYGDKRSSAFTQGWGGKTNALKWYVFLYEDATIYLDRKKDKFDEIVNNILA